MNFSEDYSLIGLELLPKHVAPSNATIRIESTPDLSTVPPLRKALGDYEQQIIQMALKQTSGNILQAAKILGVPRQTLQYKIKQR